MIPETPVLSLVIPAYNEGDGIERTVLGIVQALDAANISYELIIVNNGSSDTTEDVIQACARHHLRVRAITLPLNQGKGGGILEGLREAKGDILGWTDADGQANPQSLIDVFSAVSGDVAMAVPSRDSRGSNMVRRIQSILYNGFFQLLFAVPFTDINAPPKFIRRSAYEEIQPKHRDWFLDAECIIKLSRLEKKIVQVKIRWDERESGTSKVRLSTSVEFLKNMLVYFLHIK